MTDKPQPDKFDWATELSDAHGHVTLSAQEAKEIGARLRSMRVKLKTYEDLGDAGSDVQLLRTGYAAARLEIESLKSQLAEHASHGQAPAQAAPQPSPAAQGDALDAETLRNAKRYRLIRDVPYSDDVRSVLVHQQNAAMDRVIDAAIAAQEGK